MLVLVLALMPTKPKVFIDGQAGTTGLRIRELLARRAELELMELSTVHRRDEPARRELLNAADVSILCLPDDAAKQAVAMIENGNARVIDASTAHRVASEFVYGLPELESGQRAAIAAAKRVSNPGCYPTGVVLLLRPLIDAGLLVPDAPLCIHALSGYSGGGNAKIERWEHSVPDLRALPFEAPYALSKQHKHVPEMKHYAHLAREPYFAPSVAAFRCGMRIQIPLHAAALATGVNAAALFSALEARYTGERFVHVKAIAEEEEFDELELDPRACNGTNRVALRVLAHPSGHVMLIAILDNLAKGAAGAAVQNLNLMLGLPETAGLSRVA